MQALKLTICEDVQAAYDKGYVYREPDFKSAELAEAVIIRHGMESGRSSVDLIFEDASGQKYIAMTTLALLKTFLGSVDM